MSSRTARALILALGLAAGAASALPQSRWLVGAAAGYATQLDNGSLDHGSLSAQVSALRPIGRTLALGVEAGWTRHDVLHQHFEGEDFGGVLVNRDWDRVRLYGLREANTYRTVRQDNGQVVPEFSRSDDRIAAAPGVSAGVGVDYFPNGGRLGLGLAARVRGAARPYDDYILGVGFVALQAGITLR